MCNSTLVLAFFFGTFHINMNPLVVERGISKEINTRLINL